MNGSPFDDNLDDRALGDALRRVAGSVPDAEAALPGLHRRVRVARIRRVSAVAASVAALAISGTAVGLAARGGNERIGPMDTTVTLPDDSATSSSIPTTDVTVPDDNAIGDGDNDGPDDIDSPAGPSGYTPGRGTTTTGPAGTNPPSSTSSTTIDNGDDDGEDTEDQDGEPGRDRSTGKAAPSTPALAPRRGETGAATVRRCTSEAGAFTAVFDSVVFATAVAPASGYVVDHVEQETDAARVAFRRDDAETVVVARWSGSLFSCSAEA